MTTATQTTTTVNPIEAAVAPLKAVIIDRTEQYAREMVASASGLLEAAGWDLDAVAPIPNGSMTRPMYMHAKHRRTFFSSITKPRQAVRYSSREPLLVDMDPQRMERFVEEAKKAAAADHDAFVAKLVGKVGACAAAQLHGNDVWKGSTLYVMKNDDAVEVWKTRMIVNRSCLGKLFNQFPTRKAN